MQYADVDYCGRGEITLGNVDGTTGRVSTIIASSAHTIVVDL